MHVCVLGKSNVLLDFRFTIFLIKGDRLFININIIIMRHVTMDLGCTWASQLGSHLHSTLIIFKILDLLLFAEFLLNKTFIFFHFSRNVSNDPNNGNTAKNKVDSQSEQGKISVEQSKPWQNSLNSCYFPSFFLLHWALLKLTLELFIIRAAMVYNLAFYFLIVTCLLPSAAPNTFG